MGSVDLYLPVLWVGFSHTPKQPALLHQRMHTCPVPGCEETDLTAPITINNPEVQGDNIKGVTPDDLSFEFSFVDPYVDDVGSIYICNDCWNARKHLR